ncbi:MAG: CoA transferase, partial [Myxococcota bacterium]
MMQGLRDLRVIDFSSRIAGPYVSKLLADAGADVIKVEGSEGDPLRRWSSSGGKLGDEDGAFFKFLNGSKRSLVGRPDDAAVLELIAGADLVIEDLEPGVIDELDLCARFPSLVWLSITPFGRGGPYTTRPATEFTIQAEAGAIGNRGLLSQPPYMAGGRTTEWIAGTYAAVAALAAVRRAKRNGRGEHIDFSMLEVINVAGTMYLDLMYSLAGRPAISGPGRSVEIPSIEPTLDGWVGFNTNSRQQFTDFLLLIERTDLLEDKELAMIRTRAARMDEWNAAVRAWTTRHSTAEIVEKASLLRIPVAPVNDGKSVLEHEQFKARGVFEKNPGGDFLQPRPPYLIDGERIRRPEAAPKLGQHTGTIEARTPSRSNKSGSNESAASSAGAELPLAGLRVLDATAWWAGPSSTHMLAMLGAEVIHLESIQRPDGMRLAAGAFVARDNWWEWSGMFVGTNSNKKGLTLDLGNPRGLELVKKLIPLCDLVVENFSPRVFENFGLGWEQIHALAPRTLLVRMPAFGLDGPWRNNVGFAQTMEQMTGLAWLTGHVDDQPRIQRGPCDPLAGMHAAFAALVGLAERDHSGRGHHLECAMVEGALNAASEQVIEYTAYGNVMQRNGNRCPTAAPQGLYPCRGEEAWLALSIESEAQWQALRQALGEPEWAQDPALQSLAGRHAHHDRIDEALFAWAADRDLDATIHLL